MKLKKKTHKILLLGFIGVLPLLFLNFYNEDNDDDTNFEISKSLDIYTTLLRELSISYVDTIDHSSLVKKSITEMLKSLDPYTNFIPESKLEDFNFMTTGEYAGIGALISKRGEFVIIAELYKNFPADKAQLKVGDKILKINNVELKDKSISDISELLKGQKNTEVEVLIERYGENKPIKKKIIRDKISIPSVPYYGMLNDSIGYIYLSNFTSGCSNSLKLSLISLQENNNLKYLILDVRNNPGGLLHEAVNVTNLFIDQGEEVVSTKGRIKQWNRHYKTLTKPINTKIPLAVLVNRSSASASEIVSGAIQDLDRGVVIGQKTFGKGLVQSTRELSYNTKLKVTTAKYYIPSGRCIQALDYSHRNKDGSVGNIPDSLISKFKTKNGRIVYDGGGIIPDIKIPKRKYNRVIYELLEQYLIFDFANQFYYENTGIPPIEKFVITDEVFDNFINFVLQKEFKYESESQEALTKLIGAAKKNKYFDKIESNINILKEKIERNIKNDLQLNGDDIKEIIKREIAKRYYYREGEIISSLQNDSIIIATKNILINEEEYNNILAPHQTIDDTIHIE